MSKNAPWKYTYKDCDEYGDGEVVDARGDMVAITTGPNYGAHHDAGSAHFESIARLIAAAPELLEALQMVEDAYRNHLSETGEHSIPYSPLAKIRAAIAKATGEA